MHQGQPSPEKYIKGDTRQKLATHVAAVCTSGIACLFNTRVKKRRVRDRRWRSIDTLASNSSANGITHDDEVALCLSYSNLIWWAMFSCVRKRFVRIFQTGFPIHASQK
jgi:hypothetical protein